MISLLNDTSLFNFSSGSGDFSIKRVGLNMFFCACPLIRYRHFQFGLGSRELCSLPAAFTRLLRRADGGGGLRGGRRRSGGAWLDHRGRVSSPHVSKGSSFGFFNSKDEIIRSDRRLYLTTLSPYLRAGYGHDPRRAYAGFGEGGWGRRVARAGGGGAAGRGWVVGFAV